MKHQYLPAKVKLGNEDFDFQHEMLFFVVEGIVDYTKGRGESGDIDPIFRIFHDYIDMYFKHEEDRMRELNYPDIDKHISEHGTFEIRVLDLERAFMTAPDRASKVAIARTVLDYLYDWMETHFVRTDKEFCDYMAAREH
ncbi:MAG: hemerythrin domain-containing protein [Magnetococcales bacterium]|nr:hemerythrin domain-containing protein [Magnetococcales bacterium]MBF0156088.1 hemerythrin domain-containing protein [Magnetococcales bacterium]